MTTGPIQMLLAFSAVALAGPPGLRPVTESRTTKSLTAAVMAGQTYLADRDVQVDLNFPDGRIGKGRLYILYEPVSGFYLQKLEWLPDSYPAPSFEYLEKSCRVGIAGDRLFVARFQGGVVVEDSTERAASIDEAEAKALKWYADRLSQVEYRMTRDPIHTSLLTVFREAFPNGFFLSDLEPTRLDDGREKFTIKVVEVTWNGSSLSRTPLIPGPVLLQK